MPGRRISHHRHRAIAATAQSPAAISTGRTGCPASSDPLLIAATVITAIQLACWPWATSSPSAGQPLAGNFGAEDLLDPFYRAPYWQALRQPEIFPRMAGRAELPVGGHPCGGKSGDADLAAYQHAVAAGDPRRHPGGEDINGAPVPRVERMLFRLLHSGVLAKRRKSGDLSSFRQQRAERL